MPQRGPFGPLGVLGPQPCSGGAWGQISHVGQRVRRRRACPDPWSLGSWAKLGPVVRVTLVRWPRQ
eukprot:13372895-Alexandrium_andersonii.AAC.1